MRTDAHRSTDCGWVFAQHFCNRLGPAYLALKNILDESNATRPGVLNDIKRRSREETFTRESIAQVIHAHSDLVRRSLQQYLIRLNSFLQINLLYVNFAMTHYPEADEASNLMYAFMILISSLAHRVSAQANALISASPDSDATL